MPELPEVETMSRDLKAEVLGRKIKGVWTDWPRIIKNGNARSFEKAMSDAVVKDVFRRGKYLVLKLDSKEASNFFVFHPKMTGHPYLLENWTKAKHLHLALIFKDGTVLGFKDIRKFSRAYLFKDLEELENSLGLGPEPLEVGFTEARFKEILSKSKYRRIKDLLLDQTKLAGIGNIYADEALWFAKINPERKAQSLSGEEIKKLYLGIVAILKKAILKRGSSVRTYRTPSGEPGGYAVLLKAYGRQDLPCPRCGAKIVRKRVGGRSAHYCPVCQKI